MSSSLLFFKAIRELDNNPEQLLVDDQRTAQNRAVLHGLYAFIQAHCPTGEVIKITIAPVGKSITFIFEIVCVKTGKIFNHSRRMKVSAAVAVFIWFSTVDVDVPVDIPKLTDTEQTNNQQMKVSGSPSGSSYISETWANLLSSNAN